MSHVCTCDECVPEPFEDRCRHELEAERRNEIIIELREQIGRDGGEIRRLDKEAEALREALRKARSELDAWRRYAENRKMGAARTHRTLLAEIDSALVAAQQDAEQT